MSKVAKFSLHEEIVSEIGEFKQILTSYINQTFPGKEFELANEEIHQLYHLYNNARDVTPQSWGTNPKTFEIRRCLVRLATFERIWSLAVLESNTAEIIKTKHAWFTQAQKNNQLTLLDFEQLIERVRKIILEARRIGDDGSIQQLYAASRVTCFFTKTVPTDIILRENEIEPKADSEQYLTDISNIAQSRFIGISLIDNLSPAAKHKLMFSYLPLHLRALIFGEGPKKRMLQGLETLDEIAPDNLQAFALMTWELRWLINLFGFEPALGSAYYTHTTHQLTFFMLQELEKKNRNPTYAIFENYFEYRATLAGVAFANVQEQQFFGHLVAMHTMIPIISPDLGEQMKKGYEQFKMAHPEINLAEIYNIFFNSDAQTPTYTPAILVNAHKILNDDLFVIYLNPDETFLEAATQFLCETLAHIYKLAESNPDKIISCANFARNNLDATLKIWFQNDRKLNCDLDERYELKVKNTTSITMVF